MLNALNQSASKHIIIIEDPIEFVHTPQPCLIQQREVGVHTHSFANALRAALREDPDVILVGELHDLETIRLVKQGLVDAKEAASWAKFPDRFAVKH